MMKLKPYLLSLSLFAALLVLAGWALSGEQQPDKMDMKKMQEMMQKCMELNKPGPAHRRLEAMVGEWETETRFWWGGPGTPSTTSKGTSVHRWILDGRYIEQVYKCNMTMPDFANPGKMITTPYEGRGITGYDNFRNLYVNTWCDSMGTQMFITKGSYLPKEKKFVYYGEMDEPTLQVTGRMVKCVATMVNKDKHLFEMYDLHAGDDYRVMEMVYTRKK